MKEDGHVGEQHGAQPGKGGERLAAVGEPTGLEHRKGRWLVEGVQGRGRRGLVVRDGVKYPC